MDNNSARYGSCRRPPARRRRNGSRQDGRRRRVQLPERLPIGLAQRRLNLGLIGNATSGRAWCPGSIWRPRRFLAGRSHRRIFKRPSGLNPAAVAVTPAQERRHGAGLGTDAGRRASSIRTCRCRKTSRLGWLQVGRQLKSRYQSVQSGPDQQHRGDAGSSTFGQSTSQCRLSCASRR